MPKLKSLSGREVISVLETFGFEQAAQRGSHVKLRRLLAGGTKQTLTIPNHVELDKGTIKAIYR
jgi:predicted RNA binding protein YcfA (HicA-like mRNA interferase family)